MYNPNGLPTAVLPAGLSTLNIAYNATWVTQPDSVWGGGRPRQRFWIGTGGRVDSVQLGGSSSSIKTRYLYDLRGRVTHVKDANNNIVTSTVYGAINDNTLRATSRQVTHEYGHDGYGRVTSDSVVGMGKTRLEYDVLNRARQVWDPVNANPTEFVYDNVYLIRVIDPKLQDYEFGYNDLGWNVWKEDPAAARDSLWYDRDGGLVRWKTRRGHLLESSYDVLHRLVKKWGTQTTTDTFTYFTAGSPAAPSWIRTSNANATETVYLNSTTGLAERVELAVGGRTYDIYAQYLTGASGAGQVDSVWAVGPPGTSFMGRRYLWNTATNGMLATLRLAGKNATMAYDSERRPTSTTFFAGDVTTRDFIISDPVARVESDQLALASLTRRLEYGIGKVSAQWEWDGPADFGRLFGYDKLGRLAKDTAATVTHDTCIWEAGFGWRCPNPTVDSVVTYTYDPAGNITSVASSTGYSETGTYGPGNRIQTFGGCSYLTATDGTVTQRTCGATVTDFWWSSEGRLDSLQHAGTKIRHGYDGSGRLVRRQVGTTTRYFLWHGDHLFAELDANGIDAVEYSYYPGMDWPHAIGLADSVYFHHLDGLGNVIGLVKHDKELRARYAYDLWGERILGWSSEDLSGQTNRAEFKGALRFGEQTELYYMRNRWYEPRTGRFLSEDPIGLAGGMNPYAFGANDPVNLRDPDGRCPLSRLRFWGSCSWCRLLSNRRGAGPAPVQFRPARSKHRHRRRCWAHDS
ncbi:MAG: RHS repeat domain-containing protein, partial [Gammaproteobacteria bacterium]